MDDRMAQWVEFGKRELTRWAQAASIGEHVFLFADCSANPWPVDAWGACEATLRARGLALAPDDRGMAVVARARC